MSAPAKLALAGPFRAGKGAVQAHLEGTYDFTSFAFGDELKAVVKRLYPWVIGKDRKLLQQLGEHLTQFNTDIFIDSTLYRMKTVVESGIACTNRVLIGDVRRQREFDRLKALGFTIIRVTAPEELRLVRAQAAGDVFSAEDMHHSTETAVEGFAVDYEVTNDGTLGELWAQVDGIMRELGVSPVR